MSSWGRRTWLFWVVLAIVYVVAAITALPQWIVSLTAGQADANTQLNAVTSTRGALLGILTPVVIVIGGIAAFRNYQEVREQNIRTNALTLLDRDETRRLRRAELYAALVSACQGCWETSVALFHADRDNVNFLYDAGRMDHNYLWFADEKDQKSRAMNLAHERVMLLGTDAVQDSAIALVLHCHKEISAKALAKPKVTDEEFRRVTVPEYNLLQRAFLDAARSDLAVTR